MVNGDFRKIKEFERTLSVISKTAIPVASRNALNTAAFDARKRAQALIARQFVLRNKWTSGSIRVETTRTLSMKQQESVVGSLEEYMRVQEFGGTRSGGRHGAPVPTSATSGEGKARVRRKAQRRQNKLHSVRVSRFNAGGSTPAQRRVRQVQEAVKTGQRWSYMELSSTRRGIVKITGGRKNFKRGWPKGATVTMMHDLSHKTIRTPPAPWLLPAVKSTTLQLPRFYREALLFQLRKLK